MHISKSATLLRRMVLILATLSIAGATSVAAQEVGQVVAFEGSAEIVRAGATLAVQPGTPIQKKDEVRTGKPGRVRIVFQDQSVVTVADDSRLTIDEQVFDPATNSAQSAVGLLKGKVSSIVSAYYNWSGAKYEVKTPTAVAGVRGTEFVVTYDETADATEVLGFSGEVRVHSLANLEGPGVLVTANQMSKVARGRSPSHPQQIEDQRFRQELDGLDFFGAGLGYHLTLPDPLHAGTSVLAPDRAPANAVDPLHPAANPDVSNLVGKSPLVFGSNTGQVGVSINFPK